MVIVKFLLIAAGAALVVVAAAHKCVEYKNVAARKRLEAAERRAEKLPEAELKLRVQLAGMICGVAIVSLLTSSSFDVVPAAIRVSQISGTEAKVLYSRIDLSSRFETLANPDTHTLTLTGDSTDEQAGPDSGQLLSVAE